MFLELPQCPMTSAPSLACPFAGGDGIEEEDQNTFAIKALQWYLATACAPA
jgi:hypothetical protein